MGSKHIKLWKLNGASVKGMRVDWGSKKAESVLCAEGLQGQFVIGTMSGKLF